MAIFYSDLGVFRPKNNKIVYSFIKKVNIFKIRSQIIKNNFTNEKMKVFETHLITVHNSY